MPKAIRIRRTGGPDAMRWEDVEVGTPGPGEIRIRHEAVGLNYIDVYFRTGLYPAPSLPFSPGMEGAGSSKRSGRASTRWRWGIGSPMPRLRSAPTRRNA